MDAARIIRPLCHSLQYPFSAILKMPKLRIKSGKGATVRRRRRLAGTYSIFDKDRLKH